MEAQVPEAASREPENSEAQAPTTQGAKEHKLLYLFSGPPRPDDGLGKFLEEFGIECVFVDREVNELHGLLDQDVWENVRNDFNLENQVELKKYVNHNNLSTYFWNRWRSEYVPSLREYKRFTAEQIILSPVLVTLCRYMKIGNRDKSGY